jgi:hypothetical protein
VYDSHTESHAKGVGDRNHQSRKVLWNNSATGVESLPCPGQLAIPGADQYELWLLLWFSSAHIVQGVN